MLKFDTQSEYDIATSNLETKDLRLFVHKLSKNSTYL